MVYQMVIEGNNIVLKIDVNTVGLVCFEKK